MVFRVQPWTHARKLKALAVCQHHVSALILMISKKFIFLFIWISMSRSFHHNLVQFLNRDLYHLATGQLTSIVN